MAKRDPEETAAKRAANFEEEGDDIVAFLRAYPDARGYALELVEFSDAPDAICRRPDGELVGLEHTRIRRSPEDSFWAGVMEFDGSMDAQDAVDEIGRLIMQKSRLREGYSTAKNILLIGIYESNFELTTAVAKQIPLEDFESSGFEEIWIADYVGIREGAHREVRLFGLFPEEYQEIFGRSMFDQKPYG